MGLTKRRDYNGRVKKLDPQIVIPASDGGPGIVTTKISLSGSDNNFTIKKAPEPFSLRDYINPSDPNHLHYYIWKWYAQIAGGTDEVIRHAVAGERGNDITVEGIGWTGKEQYKIASWNRTKRKFTVLIYSDGANGKGWVRFSMPSTIRTGNLYNNKHSRHDFRGEGFPDGTRYRARITTKDIDRTTGADINKVVLKSEVETVQNGELKTAVIDMSKFTTIEFEEVD
jgi:hypothetical protein